MDKFNTLKQIITELEADCGKFYNDGNNAAGTRVRKGMQEIKSLAQEIRLNVQEIKNSKK